MNDFIISFSTYIGENICKKILYLQFFLTVSLSDDKKACIKVTVVHLRVTIVHLRVTIGYLRATVGNLRVTIGNIRQKQLSFTPK